MRWYIPGVLDLVNYSQEEIIGFIDLGQNASSSIEKGQALEHLARYIFEKIPGVEIHDVDSMNYHLTEEIDIAVWNDQESDGLKSFPVIFLIECKNLDGNVPTRDVAYFITKIRNKGLDFGIIIASNGITGSQEDSTRAHFEIPLALSEGIRVIIINLDDILLLRNTNDLIQLIKRKVSSLYLKGSIEL